MEPTITLSQLNWEYIVGGLGIFLFGINLMGDALTNFAGGKIRDYIDKYTTNPFLAIVVGMILTAVIQSSSATTVIVISLVRSGLMKLDQAIGVSMGANIGTTITAVIISFEIEYWAYFILLFGVIITMIAKRKKQMYIAQILIGFSLIFVGLTMMGDSLKQLQYLEGFTELVLKISEQPIIGLLGGAVITGIIQSSAAVIGVVQKLYDSNAMTLIAGIAIVFGANIGTTVTSLIASIGGSHVAKRASLFHLLFNVLGSVLFMFFIYPFTHLIEILVRTLHLNNLMAIATAHFLFNFITTLLFLPFIKQFVKLMETLIPGDELTSIGDVAIEEFDESMIHNFPAGALAVSKRSILKVSDLVYSTIESSHKYLTTSDSKYRDTSIQLEEIINSLDTKITTYLLKIIKTNISEELSLEYSINLQNLKSLERISDLNVNLIEFYEVIFEYKEKLSDEAMDELAQMYDLLLHILKGAIDIYETNDPSALAAVSEAEEQMDKLERQFKTNYLYRISKNKNVADIASSVYVDILGTLERMADHSYNIATITLNPIKVHNLSLTPAELEVASASISKKE